MITLFLFLVKEYIIDLCVFETSTSGSEKNEAITIRNSSKQYGRK